MKIALAHNVTAGGAKRALYEHARHLRARGHTLHAFLPATACEDYLPLAPLCEKVTVYDDAPRHDSGGGPRRDLRQRVFGGIRRAFGPSAHDVLWDLVRTLVEGRRLRPLEAIYARMADDFRAGGYDLAYVHQDHWMLAPPVLPASPVPTVFYCQDTLRRAYEWAPEEAPGAEAGRDGFWRRRVRGARMTLPALRYVEAEERRYVANTRAATRVLANSFYSREGILRTTGVNARVCYLGIDGEFFCPDSSVAREHVVLSVGALTALKRHDFGIEAVASIPAARRPAMRIIGYEFTYGRRELGPVGERLRRLAAERGVELSIDKEVTDEALRDAYRRAGVVAFAPYLEPFGLVALEAMACAAAVVGIREGGVRETVRHEDTGLLAGRDAAEFGAALDRVLCDPALAARLGFAGRESVVTEWTWERSVDTLERHFAQVVKAAAPACD